MAGLKLTQNYLLGLNAVSRPSSSILSNFLNPSPTVLSDSSRKWISVRQRFTRFQGNLELSAIQRQDGVTKCQGIVKSLNRHYYGASYAQDNTSFVIGSWAKGTAIRPPRDVDLYFLLPSSTYYQFQSRLGNQQSALLQEVKNILLTSNPKTTIRGDGQVVVVNFESYAVEVVPAFKLDNGRYWICSTHEGGSYKEADPWSELDHINSIDKFCNNNLRPLVKMLKAWQQYCSVPIKSFQLELLAADFLKNSTWRFKDFFWFDWVIRDFFLYLNSKVDSIIVIPGTKDYLYLGNEWQSRVKTAYGHAEKACLYEEHNLVTAAGEQWQKIFGLQVPQTP